MKHAAPYALIGALLVAAIALGARAVGHSGTPRDAKTVATDVSSARHPRAGFRCSRKLHPAQAGRLGQALRSARPGAVICLTAGDYAAAGQIDLAGVTPARNVTLRPAPHARVRLGMVFLSDVNRNLTIRGFSMNRVSVTGSASGLVFAANTISHATSGFYFSAGPGDTQTNIRVLYNRMDHLTAPSLGGVATAQCVTIAGSATEEHDFIVSHNTCGPDIGDHYFQVGGIDGLVADYNTFLGPPDNEVFTQGAHNNVLQIFGDSRNVDFSYNVIRDTESRGETVLIQEGHLDNISINHNLWQEAPVCLTNQDCHSYAIEVYNAHGLSFQYNTVVDSYWGVILTATEPQSYSSGTDYAITHNIVVGTRDNRDISYLNCVARCTFDYNVTSDGSARQGGSTHHIAYWRPRWMNETWYGPRGLRFAAGFSR